LGLPSHSFGGKLAFLFDPVRLAVLAVAAIVVGTLGFAVGYLFQWFRGVLRGVSTAGDEH
jgi:hypothetical protein